MACALPDGHSQVITRSRERAQIIYDVLFSQDSLATIKRDLDITRELLDHTALSERTRNLNLSVRLKIADASHAIELVSDSTANLVDRKAPVGEVINILRHVSKISSREIHFVDESARADVCITIDQQFTEASAKNLSSVAGKQVTAWSVISNSPEQAQGCALTVSIWFPQEVYLIETVMRGLLLDGQEELFVRRHIVGLLRLGLTVQNTIFTLADALTQYRSLRPFSPPFDNSAQIESATLGCKVPRYGKVLSQKVMWAVMSGMTRAVPSSTASAKGYEQFIADKFLVSPKEYYRDRLTEIMNELNLETSSRQQQFGAGNQRVETAVEDAAKRAVESEVEGLLRCWFLIGR